MTSRVGGIPVRRDSPDGQWASEFTHPPESPNSGLMLCAGMEGRDERTYQIIGAGMKVHSHLGPRLLEKYYKEALAMEFTTRGVPWRREVPVQVFFEGRPLGPARRCDFVCFDAVVVEVKATKAFVPEDFAQALHYLEAAKLRTGLLLNFGQDRLEFRRLVRDPQWQAASKPRPLGSATDDSDTQ